MALETYGQYIHCPDLYIEHYPDLKRRIEG